MAITLVNIYRATAYLSAGNAAGVQPVATPGPPGMAETIIVATSYADAISILQQQYPTMVNFIGPVLVAANAITTGTGPFLAAAEDRVGLPPSHSDAPTQDETTTEPAQTTHKPTHNAHASGRAHTK